MPPHLVRRAGAPLYPAPRHRCRGANGLTLVVSCTTTISTARFSHTYSISTSSHNGLDAKSIALVFPIVALDRDRFRHQIGAISEQQRLAIIALMRDLQKLD